MPEPFTPNPDAEYAPRHAKPVDLAGELAESAAETQRTAARELADILSTSSAEVRPIIRKAIGPEAYSEALGYMNSQDAVDRAFADELGGVDKSVEQGRTLSRQEQDSHAIESAGMPRSMEEFDMVEHWLAQEIIATLDPYELSRSALYLHREFQDQGQHRISISRFLPDTEAGVVYEITATGAPDQFGQLKRDLFSPEAMSAARPLTPGESFDLEAKLAKYHQLMTTIAKLTPEEILEHARSLNGPEA